MVDYISAIAESLRDSKQSQPCSDEEKKRNLLEAMQILAAKAHQSETEIKNRLEED